MGCLDRRGDRHSGQREERLGVAGRTDRRAHPGSPFDCIIYDECHDTATDLRLVRELGSTFIRDPRSISRASRLAVGDWS
jgi:hypothetical protein